MAGVALEAGLGALSIVVKLATTAARESPGVPSRLPAAPLVRYKQDMSALAALLAVALAGPGPVAPPLSSTSDNDAIYAEIAAGDPTLTRSPAPLERLLAATALAEEKLRQAADPDDMSDALTLTAAGRKAAYMRTNEILHLCRLIAAAEHVLERKGVPPGLEAAATDFRQEARDSLGGKPCEPTPNSPPPTEHRPILATAIAPTEPPVAPPPVDRVPRRHVRAGVGTLVPGLLLFAPMAGLLAYRADGRRELVAINADTKLRPATATEAARVTELDNRHIATTAGAVALGVTGAALVVTGAVLLATGGRRHRVAVAPWGGRGIGGLVLQGRF